MTTSGGGAPANLNSAASSARSMPSMPSAGGASQRRRSEPGPVGASMGAAPATKRSSLTMMSPSPSLTVPADLAPAASASSKASGSASSSFSGGAKPPPPKLETTARSVYGAAGGVSASQASAGQPGDHPSSSSAPRGGADALPRSEASARSVYGAGASAAAASSSAAAPGNPSSAPRGAGALPKSETSARSVYGAAGGVSSSQASAGQPADPSSAPRSSAHTLSKSETSARSLYGGVSSSQASAGQPADPPSAPVGGSANTQPRSEQSARAGMSSSQGSLGPANPPSKPAEDAEAVGNPFPARGDGATADDDARAPASVPMHRPTLAGPVVDMPLGLAGLSPGFYGEALSALGNATEARMKAEREYQEWETALLRSDITRIGTDADTASRVASMSAMSRAYAGGGPVAPVMPQVVEMGDYYSVDRRVRASEIEHLSVDHQRRMEAAEAECHALRDRIVVEMQDRENKWTIAHQQQERALVERERELARKDADLRRALDDYERQVSCTDDEIRRRSLDAEEARRRTTQAIEAKLRKELRAELEMSIKAETEHRLRPEITHEVEARVQIDFQNSCRAMKEELERAKDRMEVEIELALEPQVKQRLLPMLKAQAEAEVHQTLLSRVDEAAAAVTRLRDELAVTTAERDHLSAELGSLQMTHHSDFSAIEAQLLAEQDRAKLLARDVCAASEKLERFEEERRLYPLLKEIEDDSDPWAEVNAQLDDLKKENSQLKADSQFAAREIEMLRSQLMQNPGHAGAAPDQPIPLMQLYASPRTASPRNVSPLRGRTGGRQAIGGAGSPRLPSAALHAQPQNAMNSLFSSVRNSDPYGNEPSRSLSNKKRQAGLRTPANTIVFKNRFRHMPSKEVNSPTFPFKKEDRERIFFAEMEFLKENTEKQQRDRRKQKAGQSTPRGQNMRI
ncbi:hypothetical protein DIPPA_30849 [Diplonema papillatum]|nr:hypothetical protein DIPPA_30849 [Diplonema papillatum]